MAVILLILVFVGLFWVITSLRANGGVGPHPPRDSHDTGYIPGLTDGVIPIPSVDAPPTSDPEPHHHDHASHHDSHHSAPSPFDSGFDPGHNGSADGGSPPDNYHH